MNKSSAHLLACHNAQDFPPRKWAVVKAVAGELHQPYYVEEFTEAIPTEQIEAVYGSEGKTVTVNYYDKSVTQ